MAEEKAQAAPVEFANAKADGRARSGESSQPAMTPLRAEQPGGIEQHPSRGSLGDVRPAQHPGIQAALGAGEPDSVRVSAKIMAGMQGVIDDLRARLDAVEAERDAETIRADHRAADSDRLAERLAAIDECDDCDLCHRHVR